MLLQHVEHFLGTLGSHRQALGTAVTSRRGAVGGSSGEACRSAAPSTAPLPSLYNTLDRPRTHTSRAEVRSTITTDQSIRRSERSEPACSERRARELSLREHEKGGGRENTHTLHTGPATTSVLCSLSRRVVHSPSPSRVWMSVKVSVRDEWLVILGYIRKSAPYCHT